MLILITVVHVIACFILVLVVLLQAGKGADMGAVFGGASSTIFGSSGAGNFLTRLTTGAAIVFMATSLALTYVGHSHSTIMPESAARKSAAAAPAQPQPEPADDADKAADAESAAVANGAAAPAEGAAPANDAAKPAAPADQAAQPAAPAAPVAPAAP